MTREEAIKKINAIKKYLTAGNPIWDAREIDEVLDMAIEALQAEPVVRCKDCTKLNRLKKYTGFGEVQYVCENTKMTVYETDYCNYGEKKTHTD